VLTVSETTRPAKRRQRASGWRVLLMLAIVFASYFAVANLTGNTPKIPTARAYFICCKWGGQPAPHTCCGNFNIYYEDSVDNFSQFTNAEHGRLAWHNDPVALIYVQHTGASSFWHAAVFNNVNDGRDGFTSITSGGGWITSATSWANYAPVHTYPANKAQGLWAHEFGHALGLNHNDGSPSCGSVTLMYSTEYRYNTCNVYTPKADEENGVNSLY
jgi:hypothetical protein